ncbi:protein FAM237B [Chrysemys picta bellii]|uniref:protein FAM237B n=1 Tax=Chrysemys picta bellii TaxID=8478 RepID=UPI0032B1DC11
MDSVCRRRWYLQLGCILIVNLVYANPEYQKEPPGSLGEIDHHCWEISSHRLVEMKKLKVADAIIALWDFMMFLKESPKAKHNELFNDLAQNFWDMVRLLKTSVLGQNGRKMKIPQQDDIKLKEKSLLVKSTACTVTVYEHCSFDGF